jgi:predicted DNA-binding protein (MmcQ/YjbR family)
MNVEQIREFCLGLPSTSEDFPFDESVLVIRVNKKIFALIPLNNPGQMNLKCDPERAIELREKYDRLIKPGFHMNKKLWNTIHFDLLPEKLVKELILHSWELIVARLPKKEQLQLPSVCLH